MGQEELNGESDQMMRAMIDPSGTGCLGTPDDITEAAAFLLGTGTDLLVDGGVAAALHAERLTPRA